MQLATVIIINILMLKFIVFLMVVAEVVLGVVVLGAVVLGAVPADALFSVPLPSTIHSFEQWSSYISHMLCSTTHDTIKFGTLARFESTLLRRIRHLPFKLPKAFSTTMFMLLQKKAQKAGTNACQQSTNSSSHQIVRSLLVVWC